MDAGKVQDLQKAQEGVKSARNFLEVMETKTKKDLVKDSALKSGDNCPLDKDNDGFLILSHDDMDKQKADLEASQSNEKVLEQKLAKALETIDQQKAKIEDMEFQEADLAKELSKVQEVTVRQKVEIEAVHEKMVQQLSAIQEKDKALSSKMSPCPKQEKEVESKSQQKSTIFWGVIFLAVFLGQVLINQTPNEDFKIEIQKANEIIADQKSQIQMLIFREKNFENKLESLKENISSKDNSLVYKSKNTQTSWVLQRS